MSSTRILIAEDEITFRHMLKTFLTKWGYQPTVVSDGLDGWKILQQDDRPRLALLDWMMPSMDGVELCRAIRSRKPEPYVYLLLLTGRDQTQDVVEGIEAGADDYLIKPFDPQELRVRIHAGERIIELEDRLRHTQDALRDLATHDPLTGLLNRRAALDALRAELNRGCRERNPLCLVMADIDYFKRVNDAHGHAAGDEVLVEVAHRMQKSLRRYDTAGRLGGEEFLLVLPGCSLDEGVQLAERLGCLVGSEPVKWEDKRIEVTISLGVAAANQLAPLTVEALLRAADAALYRAKAAGRNRVDFAAPPSPIAALPRVN
jgi:diguanylate cyclase (GGDEF)-like protein